MTETRMTLPMIRGLQESFDVDDITVVADADMLSGANKKAIVDAGLHYIIGTKFKDLPYVIAQWRRGHPDQDYEDKQLWLEADRTGRGPDGIPHRITYYRSSWDRARRTLKGIDEQVAKAEKAVAGKIAVKRNRFVDLKAPNKQVNWVSANKNKALAGIKGYETSRVDLQPEEVIGAYGRLLKIAKAFGCRSPIQKPGRSTTANASPSMPT